MASVKSLQYHCMLAFIHALPREEKRELCAEVMKATNSITLNTLEQIEDVPTKWMSRYLLTFTKQDYVFPDDVALALRIFDFIKKYAVHGHWETRLDHNRKPKTVFVIGFAEPLVMRDGHVIEDRFCYQGCNYSKDRFFEIIQGFGIKPSVEIYLRPCKFYIGNDEISVLTLHQFLTRNNNPVLGLAVMSCGLVRSAEELVAAGFSERKAEVEQLFIESPVVPDESSKA